MTSYIITLDKLAKELGYYLWRAIFEPKLQPFLFKNKIWTIAKKHIKFSKRSSWVKYDEEYYIDFATPCRK